MTTEDDPLTIGETTDANVEAEIEALRAPMLRHTLYVITWTKTGGHDPREVRALLPVHLRFMLELEERGVLFASGPLENEDGPSPNGLTVVRCGSFAEAAAIARAEPYCERGMRTFAVQRWELNEGGFSLRVRFGTGGFTVA